jgi:acetoin utilization deacetylase AcuC-like enzyme
VLDPLCARHDTGYGHPESPRRLDAISAGVEAAAGSVNLLRLQARDAAVSEVCYVHTPGYVALVQSDCEDGEGSLRTGDTTVCEESCVVALRAAGSVLAATDAVMAGECRNAFCAVRPPGHHATPDRGMGFCVFNNVAIAARHVQKRYGLERVLIADWDVHHGNGTQDAFYSDPSVFYFSTHQWPHYPGTGAASERGAGAGAGRTMNVPLAAGSGGREVLGAFREQLAPAMAGFKPQFVLVSAGFDSRAGDPLGGLLLNDNDFAELTRILMGIADEHCAGRLVSVLEGGYSLEGLTAAAKSHILALGGGG